MRTTVQLFGTIVHMMMGEGADDDRSQAERMRAGDWYVWGDEEISAIAARARDLMRAIQRAELAGEDVRPLQAELFGRLGKDVEVRPPVRVDLGRNIMIGDRTFVNYNLTALDIATIMIGADCQIGPNVQLLTPIHPVEAEPRRARLEAARPIMIGDNVWLGGGVIVCPGVSIGENSVIGAGAVVTRDVPANSVAVGNPARVIREVPAR